MQAGQDKREEHPQGKQDEREEHLQDKHKAPTHPITSPCPYVYAASVVIVGAGPTGLAAANLFGLLGIDTLLFERNAGLSSFPKAISIDDEGLRICQAMGLDQELLPEILLDIDAHYLSRGRYLAKVAPTSNRNGYPLISTFYQTAFEATLLKGLDRFPHVRTHFQHTVESFEQQEHGVCLSVRNPDGTLLQVECTYLLACDGGKSAIRQALNIPMRFPLAKLLPWARTNSRRSRAVEHAQRWLVVDCVDDDDPLTAAIFFCNPARPAVTVPAPHKGRRWEFMLLKGEREEDVLDTARIQALIQQARAAQKQAMSEKPAHITRRAVYAFHAVLATHFSSKRVFLLGDAAHLMPPFGGQGMNSGLRDAHNLCWKLHLVLQGLADAHILATYDQERHPHVAQMILFSWLLGKIIMPTARPLAFLRDLFFRSICTIPFVREALTEAKVKPQPPYARGCLLFRNSKASKRLTGAMLPQPQVVTLEQQQILLDQALGDGFALLRLHHDPTRAFASLKAEQWSWLKARFVCILPDQSRAEEVVQNDCTVVIDSEQRLSAFFRHNQDIYVLVRPDRYVMGVFAVEQAGQFVTELRKFMAKKPAQL
ncbi:MAG TPA: FAD-dependent monooxygenase [Ktedonobacteraceae bacterium]|nr:FAD-dependent monooxygenase [Ktedonobacteraceae bacterium]